MPHCIVTSHPDYLKLLKESGLKEPILKAKISVWQEKTGNLDRFPTLSELNSVGKQYQKLTAEEKAKTIEQVTKEHRSIAALKDLAHKLAHRVGGKVEFVNRTDVDWKGYNQGVKSVLNEAYMTPDTPFHEILAHPIIRAIKNRKTHYKTGETAEFHGYGEPYRVTIEKIYDDTLEADIIDEKGNKQKVDLFELNKTQNTLLYQSLLKELETGRGKEVFEQVKRNYNKRYEIRETQEDGITWYHLVNLSENSAITSVNKSTIEKEASKVQMNYTLEEQQEEAIITLLGLMAADKLDAKKDATLISKLKELWKQISDFVKSLLSGNISENEINNIIENEVTYTDENNNPCAKDGIRGKFTKGSQWGIVKDLKGYPSHAQGGVDIKLGKDGFSFTGKDGIIKARHGLVLPKIK